MIVDESDLDVDAPKESKTLGTIFGHAITQDVVT
jgi:hypothetical protein